MIQSRGLALKLFGHGVHHRLDQFHNTVICSRAESASPPSSQHLQLLDGEFHYTLHLRGEKQGVYKSTGFSASTTDDQYNTVSRWQALSGVNPKFHAGS
ncbi:MAG: hypothetical protein NVV73_07525 [Cellvibrionaceae bacterium]|nr:hypothetical protein [Cellvibrionaceae bacterium]